MLPATTLRTSSWLSKCAALVDIYAYWTETYSQGPCCACCVASQKMLKPVVFEITGNGRLYKTLAFTSEFACFKSPLSISNNLPSK